VETLQKRGKLKHQCIFLKEQLILILPHLKRLVATHVMVLRARFIHWTKPLSSSLPLGTLADLARNKSELLAENALLRQQLIVLKRQVKRPTCTKTDRILLVLLARGVRAWKQTLFLVQPETLLRWHREAFRLFWSRRSKAISHKPRVAAETITLIREMATKNRLWGAERIRGELLKLDIHVCKRTIQKYMRQVRTHQPIGQKWATFLPNHAEEIWSCDFLQVTDLFFRPLFAFFILELKSRKVIHVGVTRSPTDPWVARTAPRSYPLWACAKVSNS
jgi:putative transposase